MRAFDCVFYIYLAYKNFWNYLVFSDNYLGIRIPNNSNYLVQLWFSLSYSHTTTLEMLLHLIIFKVVMIMVSSDAMSQ